MLKYKALWIDDSTESRDTKIEGIGEFLIDEGFVFEPILKEDAEDIGKHLNDPELDIVITDFNGINVTELVDKVQALEKYIDLVLYSENPPLEFDNVARSYPWIYPCTRDDVEDTIKKVIQSTIRRTQNVINMRGIVISEGIDVENQIEEIILSYFQNEKDLAQKILDARNTCDFGKKIAFLHSILNKVNKYLNNIIADTSLSSAIREECKQYVVEFTPLRNICKKLAKQVMEPRNILAHVEYVINEDNKPFLKSLERGYEAIVIDSQWCKEKRLALNEHQQNLGEIKKFIEAWNGFRANNILKAYGV